jgi:glycosyltransferase involved in cell wall biosynthesis
MINGKKICVVVPAYNEEQQISKVINNMPEFVDRIVVVDDNSKDGTREKVLSLIEKNSTAKLTVTRKNPEESVENVYGYADRVISEIEKEELKLFAESEIVNKNPDTDRLILIRNLKNVGVGAAIARGYKWAKDSGIDCTAVMAGDAQMDPAELRGICEPVAENDVDYVKGNRLLHRGAWFVIPKIRFFGNSILSIFTKIASGYWKISDTQTGYTAISLNALKSIKLHKIYKKYGMPNDMLVKLNIAYCKIKEVPIKPVYKIGEKSKMNILFVIPKISFLLLKLFFQRLWVKYLFKDFHPLFLLYHLGIFLLIIDMPYIYKVLKAILFNQNLNFEPLFAFLFLSISSFQSLLFAMWMDIQDNERLHK